MHAITPLGESLTYLPATTESQLINAGMSFAMVRSLAPIQDKAESIALTERLKEIILSYEHLVRRTKKSLQKNADGVTLDGLEILVKTEKFLKEALNSLSKLK